MIESNLFAKPHVYSRVSTAVTDVDNDNDIDDSGDDNHNYTTKVKGKIMAESSVHNDNNKQNRAKLQNASKTGDLVVEDLDELNRLYINRHNPNRFNEYQETYRKPLQSDKRKKIKKKRSLHENHTPKLNHWEVLALEQAKKETCNCRHHVMRLEADQVVYDWCRCKDHQHKELKDKYKSIPHPPPPPPSEAPIKSKTPPPPPPPNSLSLKELRTCDVTTFSLTEFDSQRMNCLCFFSVAPQFHCTERYLRSAPLQLFLSLPPWYRTKFFISPSSFFLNFNILNKELLLRIDRSS